MFSVVIPTLDQATLLQESLEALRFAQEVLVADGGSRDHTQEILAAFPNVQLLSLAGTSPGERGRAAMKKAHHPWVLLLYPGELPSPELAKELETLIPTSDRLYRMRIAYHYQQRPLRFGHWGSHHELRLFESNREEVSQGEGPLRPLQKEEKLTTLKGAILSQRFATPEHLVKDLLERTCHSPTRPSKGSFPLLKASCRALGVWAREWLLRGGLLDGSRGCLLAQHEAHVTWYQTLFLATPEEEQEELLQDSEFL